jgi:NTE family protein
VSVTWLRRQKDPERPSTVFVLGGGGNLGAIQVGMLRALMERGILPDQVVGCSVGAINAAAVAADPTVQGIDRLEQLWSQLDGEAICPSGRLSGLLLMTRKYRALQSNIGLRALLEASLPYERFEEAKIPFHVVATSMRTGREQWFSTGEVIDPILASAALPAVFPPVVIGGEKYIDGAIVDNVPMSKAVQVGADRIVVLHVGNFDRPRPEPKRPIDALLQSFSIARNYRFLTESQNPPEGVEVIIVPGVDPGPLKHNDFGQSERLIARAHAATASYLDAGERAASGH